MKTNLSDDFFHNTLNLIQFFINNSEKENASEALSVFSKLTRILRSSNSDKIIKIKKEIQAAELYIKLQGFRKGKSYSMEVIFNNERAGEGEIENQKILKKLEKLFKKNNVKKNITIKIYRNNNIRILNL